MRELFDLSTNSDGGITWDIAYNMPIFYRRFNIKKIIEKREKENEGIEKKNGTITNDNVVDKIKNTPLKKPDYRAKVPTR